MDLCTTANKRSRVVNFRRIPKVDFEEQLNLFADNGWSFRRLTLLNGETVVAGDCVEINQGEDCSRTSSSGEKWIAEIVEIKGEDKTTTGQKRYIKCRWFYTENNLRRYAITIGNFSSCSFSKNELVLSNHEQIVSVESILGKVTVRFFDESAADQVLIGWGERWYRYELRTGRGATDNRLVLHGRTKLPPARCGVSTCRKRYDPISDRQQYCPRESCQIWYHTQCLENVRFRKTNRECFHQRLDVMLEGLSEFDGVPRDFFKDLEDNVKLEQAGETCRFPRYQIGSISHIVWCAQSSLNRGLGYGIVGNEEIVRRARQLLREIWDERGSRLYPFDEEVARFAEFSVKPLLPIFGCMRCGLAI